MNGEHDPVELVDSEGAAVGVSTVRAAHQPPGLAHRAISVLIMGPDGRLLLQRRAADKTRFAHRWANTCCGHPPPGSDVESFARHRLSEEMGLSLPSLEVAGTFTYQATDDLTGFAEHEYDHVYLGRIAGRVPTFEPNPTEVSDWAWISAGRLRNELNDTTRRNGERYVPWLRQMLLTARAI